MTPNASHRLLWIVAAAVFALALGVIALAMTMPIAPIPAGGRPVSAIDVAALPRQVVSREQLERDASRPLRQPLVDAPPSAPVSAVAVPPPPFPPLIGTIVEPGRSVALLQMPGASIRFERVGDRVADARILTIDIGGITVACRGQTVFIRIAHAGPATNARKAGT